MRHSEVKQTAVDAAREARRREFRCFWTWPWGHVRQCAGLTQPPYRVRQIMECVECGSTIYT